MQGMEARDPHPMSPTKISFVPPKPSAPRLSAKRYAKKTRIRPAHSPGSPGSLLASADGTAITSHPVPRPCERVGTNSRPWHSVMPLQWLAKIRESRRPEGRGFWAPAFRHGLLQQARVVPRGECFLRHLRRDHEPHRNRRKSSLLFAGLRYLSASKCRAIRTPNRSG